MHPVCPFHAPSATSLRGRTPQDRQASSSISSVRQASFRLWYLWTTWRKLGSLTTGRPLDCLSRRGIKHSALAADDNPPKCPLIVEANRQTDAHIQCILAFANRLLPTYIAGARAEKIWECTSFYFRFMRCSRPNLAVKVGTLLGTFRKLFATGRWKYTFSERKFYQESK